MPVIHRESGLRFIIYVDEHPPAHVHVEGEGGSAKIEIEPVTLIWSRNLKRRDVNRAVDIVRRNSVEFGIAWANIHG
ncbi:hypothetical protein IP88_15025 [alpha proteobacterium AAP81b]|nr:hypothetical protein IP88_15025 [alpha proteobacterium AAP81b]